jgi:hypothetical protein
MKLSLCFCARLKANLLYVYLSENAIQIDFLGKNYTFYGQHIST